MHANKAWCCCCCCFSTHTHNLPGTGEDDDTDDDESAVCHVVEDTDKEVSSLGAVATVSPIACLALLVATIFNHKKSGLVNSSRVLTVQHRQSKAESKVLPSKTKRETIPHKILANHNFAAFYIFEFQVSSFGATFHLSLSPSAHSTARLRAQHSRQATFFHLI